MRLAQFWWMSVAIKVKLLRMDMIIMTPDSVTFPPPRHTCMQSWKRDFLVSLGQHETWSYSTLFRHCHKLFCFLWKKSQSANFWVCTSWNFFRFSSAISPSKKAKPSLKKPYGKYRIECVPKKVQRLRTDVYHFKVKPNKKQGKCIEWRFPLFTIDS